MRAIFPHLAFQPQLRSPGIAAPNLRARKFADPLRARELADQGAGVSQWKLVESQVSPSGNRKANVMEHKGVVVVWFAIWPIFRWKIGHMAHYN
jgi:hypothetical protein